jgi:hypothetical protein
MSRERKGGAYTGYLYTAPITTGGSLSLAVTPAGGSTAKYVSAVWDEYAHTPGATLTVPDGGSVNTGSGSSSASTGNITLATPNLVYAVCFPATESINSVVVGLTLRGNVAYSSGSTLAIASADVLNAASSPVDGTFTLAGNSYWAGLGIGILATGGLTGSAASLLANI